VIRVRSWAKVERDAESRQRQIADGIAALDELAIHRATTDRRVNEPPLHPRTGPVRRRAPLGSSRSSPVSPDSTSSTSAVRSSRPSRPSSIHSSASCSTCWESQPLAPVQVGAKRLPGARKTRSKTSDRCSSCPSARISVSSYREYELSTLRRQRPSGPAMTRPRGSDRARSR
jgi:hypothetical protein